jgi:hypothetical protein
VSAVPCSHPTARTPGREAEDVRVRMTGATGLEPAASGVTGRRSNQLSYAPKRVGPDGPGGGDYGTAGQLGSQE